MLIRRAVLEAIQRGEVSRQYRRWRRPTVKTGGTLTTAIGVLAIDAVEVVPLESLTAADARAAGYESLTALRTHLDAKADGAVYRVQLHYAGADPRIALRAQDTLDPADVASLLTRLARLDASSTQGEWTRSTLEIIRDAPGTYSGVIAERLGFERLWLKAQIRKLKTLGLTESLEVGYRLSPRGAAALIALLATRP